MNWLYLFLGDGLEVCSKQECLAKGKESLFYLHYFRLCQVPSEWEEKKKNQQKKERKKAMKQGTCIGLLTCIPVELFLG